ncbi:MAG TPA: LamG-like jellyroll fold domain-containing protein [Candidatus Binatia bacterium]|jgi:hypothetical protein|nr:LamG-like jellyroll fold domain-containing protein [Candidatus Binatia bacterium]
MITINKPALRNGLLAPLAVAVSLFGTCEAPAQTCVPPPAGLVGWWPAENTTNDLVGGNNGTLAGSVGYTNGEVGSAFSINAVSSGIALSNSAALRLQDFSIEVWVMRYSATDVSWLGGGNPGAIFHYTPGGYGLGMNPDGTVYLTKIGSSAVYSTTQVTDTGNFHHLAVTKVGTNVVIYIDGIAEPTPSYDPGFVFNGPPAIGALGGNFANSFMGAIDELSIYNRALSPGEIQLIYNAGTAGKCAGPTPPVIFVQPTNQIATAGNTVKFTVSAGGSGPLAYQWQFHGTNQVGTTNYILSLTNVQIPSQGSYQVIVTNAYGAITSDVATLTLQSPPTINDQPQSVTNFPGATAVFLVGASGTPPLTFQWQFNGTNLPGASHYSLVITNCHVANTGPYTVVVTNTYGAVTSAPALLVLNMPPMITTQPTNQSLPVGANATFVLMATGVGPLAYQWRLGGTNFAGATNANLSLFNVQSTNAGSYAAVVSNASGAVTSSVATLTITNALCTAAPTGLLGWWQAEGSPVDAVTGSNGTLVGSVAYVPGKVGQAFSLNGSGSGVLVGNMPAYQIQDFTIEAWIKRSSALKASTSSGVAELFGYGSGGYALGMLDNGLMFLSKIGIDNVTVTTPITDTNFHHVAVTKSGTNVTFFIDGVPYSVPPYNTTYFFSTQLAVGVRSDNLGNSFLGAIDEVSLYNRPLSASEIQALYYATAQGKCGYPLSWLRQPTNQTVTVGGTATLASAVAGSRPVIYQWYANGAAITKATNSSLTINGATLFDAGAYSLTASNAAGPISSTNATLSVRSAPLLANGSFETGDFSGWVTNDISSPLTPLAVRGAGYNSGYGFFSAAPTDGNFCLIEGFDGNGPGRIRAAVDVVLPASPTTLTFTYRAAWDMQNYSGSTKPRTFGVTIESFGGGPGLQTNTLLTAAPGTANYDTGNQSASLDLSAFSNLAIRISFDATIPESFTGPGFLEIDNVVLSYPPFPPLLAGRSGQNIVLSWPVSFSNFLVLSTTNLSPPVAWTALGTNSFVRSATNISLTAPATSGNNFYRLRSQ